MPGGYSYSYRGTNGFTEHALVSLGVITDVIQWGREKGLNDPKAQLNKVIEEVGEIAHEITRNHYDLEALEQPDELCDAIGDALVTIIILSDILNLDPIACLEEAYGAISGREGDTVDGTFVKKDNKEPLHDMVRKWKETKDISLAHDICELLAQE